MTSFGDSAVAELLGRISEVLGGPVPGSPSPTPSRVCWHGL